MIAVGWTGIYYEWTPNKVALSSQFEECELTKGPQRITPLRAKNACI